MKKEELSILIPAYNADCRKLAADLSEQAESIDGLRYEIIVADDGSTDHSCIDFNKETGVLPHCRFIERGSNCGRSAIRNFLAHEAHYEWLLFLDCDMTILSPRFLEGYLESDAGEVVYGGYAVGSGEPSCLRYIYEKACEPAHSARERQKRPYQNFHTCNFLVRRNVLIDHPFDERFRNYGYEDVRYGKQMKLAGIAIGHIDNPVGFCAFEDNARFVEKTEEGLRTLNEFRHELKGYSQLLTLADGIHLRAVGGVISLFHKLFGRLVRRKLCGKRPSLTLFKLYKIGYFFNLNTK